MSEQQTQEGPALLGGVRSGAWLDTQQFPDLRYAVPGLIPEGLSLLVGPPKAGKSWLALGLLLAVASPEGMALGAVPTGPARDVLYLALEDGDRRMQDRCRALLGPGESIPARFHYVTQVTPSTVLAMIGAFVREHPDTGLIVLDTLGKVMPPADPGESAYQRDYRVGGRLKVLADTHEGLSLVVLHHDRKAASDDFVDAVSGTNGLAGAADTIVVLDRRRQSTDGALKVTGRDVHEAEYALNMSDGMWRLDGADLTEAEHQAAVRRVTVNLSDTNADLVAFVGGAGTVTPAQVGARLGISAKEASDRMGDLVKSGRLVRAGRGKYVSAGTSESHESHESAGQSAIAFRNGFGSPENAGPGPTALFGTPESSHEISQGSDLGIRDFRRTRETPDSGCRLCGEPLHRLYLEAGIHPWCAEGETTPLLPSPPWHSAATA